MADFVNPRTCDIVLSANEMPGPWVACSRVQALAWSTIVRQYRKWVTDHVEEMNPAEKAAADAAEVTAARDRRAGVLDDPEDAIRAVVLIVMDELNAHTARTNELVAAIVAASSLGALRTAVGAFPPLPERPAAQLRTAIRNRLGT